ncbi:MAG: EthD domain-containing protein [Pseudomonadota bacterium]|nr:EthD domain-containing protein [Pseudomonadota bacterium]
MPPPPPPSFQNPGRYKMLICIRRKPGLTRGEFQDYWLRHHGPLAASVNARGLAPGMRGYVQNHTIDTDHMRAFREVRGMAVEPYDGVTEVWLDDPADLDMGDSLSDEIIAANQMLIEDEASFVDLEGSSVFITRDHNVFMTAPRGPFCKMIICDRRLATLSRQQFQDYWLHHHAPLASSVRERGLAPPMLAYIQNHTVDTPLIGAFRVARGMLDPGYDGLAEVWLKEMADIGRVDRDDPAQRAADDRLLEDELKFVDFAGCSVFMAAPHRIF